MKKLVLITILFIVPLVTLAQRDCGTDGYRTRALNTLKELNGRLGKNMPREGLGQKLLNLTGVIKIPVIVHIIYNRDSLQQNLPDSLIFAQINQVNMDLSGSNPDTAFVPPCFKNLIADCGIRLTLLPVDIVRTKTTKKKFMCQNRGMLTHDSDPIKFHELGGQDGKASTQYLNIWIGNISESAYHTILGYSTYPGIPGIYDGIVLNYKAVGPNSSSSPFSRGRTLTHELGHWLNLYHIWGDEKCGDDLISDTPPQDTATIGLPKALRLSCNSKDSVMYMNFMDYTDDSGTVMFTIKQRDRMRALFIEGGQRASFVQSPIINDLAIIDTSQRGDKLTPVLSNLMDIRDPQSNKLIGKTVTWRAVTNNLEKYVVQYRLLGAATWHSVNAMVNHTEIRNLQPEQYYEIKFRTLTSDGGKSSDSSPYIFQYTKTSQ